MLVGVALLLLALSQVPMPANPNLSASSSTNKVSPSTSQTSQASQASSTGAGSLGLLDGAIFFNGTIPAPGNVITSSNGVTSTTFAIPGWIVILASANAPQGSVTQLIIENGGKLLSAIPSIGLFVAGVSPQNESSFVSSVSSSPLVSSAGPDPAMVRASAVATVFRSGQSTASLANKLAKAINASDSDILTVVVDDFSTNSSHGYKVASALNAADSSVPYIELQDAPSSTVVPWSETIATIVSAINAAQLAQEKIVINLSTYGGCAEAGQCISYDAAEQWAKDERALVQQLSTLEWVKNGNVIINQAAGNDGADLNPVMKSLSADPTLGPTFNSTFQICGALGTGSKTRAGYSNYAGGIVFDEPSLPNLEGTSFVAPECTALSQELWIRFPSLTSQQIIQVIQRSATCTPDGLLQMNIAAAMSLAQNPSSKTSVTRCTTQWSGTTYWQWLGSHVPSFEQLSASGTWSFTVDSMGNLKGNSSFTETNPIYAGTYCQSTSPSVTISDQETWSGTLEQMLLDINATGGFKVTPSTITVTCVIPPPYPGAASTTNTTTYRISYPSSYTHEYFLDMDELEAGSVLYGTVDGVSVSFHLGQAQPISFSPAQPTQTTNPAVATASAWLPDRSPVSSLLVPRELQVL